AKHVDVAGCRIPSRRGPRDTPRRNVAFVHVDPMLPNLFASVCIETQHAFLHRLAFTGGVEQVHAPVHHDWGRTPSEGGLPYEVFTLGRPPGGKSFLGRGTIAGWTAPVRPIAGRRSKIRRREGDEQEE